VAEPAIAYSRTIQHLCLLKHRGPAEVHEQARKWTPRRTKEWEINFTSERLVFTQSDPDESNFLIDKARRVCLADFEEVVLLPESYASYTMHANSDLSVKEVKLGDAVVRLDSFVRRGPLAL